MYDTRQSSRPLSYAPTPYGYTPNISLSARINLDEEVKLADSAAERDLVDSLAEIYSIIRTLDGLEKAYIRDALPENEYSELCSKLLQGLSTLPRTALGRVAAPKRVGYQVLEVWNTQ